MPETLAIRRLNGDIVAEIPRVPRGGGATAEGNDVPPTFTAADVKSAFYHLFGHFPSCQVLVMEDEPVEDDDAAIPETVEEATVLINQSNADTVKSLLHAPEEFGELLEQLPAEVRRDREVAIALFQKRSRGSLGMFSRSSLYLQRAPAGVRADRGVIMTAVQEDGENLRHADPVLQADREVVLAAVKNYGLALKYASADLQADREIVLAAVENYGLALKYASAELRADQEVFLVAVKRPLG